MNTDPRSLPRLLGDTVDHFTNLIRSEVEVARAELAEKVKQAVSGVVMLVVAGLLIIPIAAVLLLALTAWLVELGLRPSLAHLSAGLLGLIVVGTLGSVGKSKVSPANLAPKRTLGEIKRNASAARGRK
jgi:uncharacterized membrane protein YqjE